MTAETLWKIHEELDEIKAEKETAHAQIMMLIDTPIMDKDELIRRYKTDEKETINQSIYPLIGVY